MFLAYAQPCRVWNLSSELLSSDPSHPSHLLPPPFLKHLTQVDDVFLSTEWCTNAAKTYRLSAADMQAHQGWMGLVNAGLPNSSYM